MLKLRRLTIPKMLRTARCVGSSREIMIERDPVMEKIRTGKGTSKNGRQWLPSEFPSLTATNAFNNET